MHLVPVGPNAIWTSYEHDLLYHAMISPNELGDLVVGYNELRDDQECPDVRTGSHHVVGTKHNFSSFGGSGL